MEVVIEKKEDCSKISFNRFPPLGVVVTGSGIDGIYKTFHPKHSYKKLGGSAIIFNDGTRWNLGTGRSPEQAVVHFTSRQGGRLPATGWQKSGRVMPGLRIFKLLNIDEDESIPVDEGILFKCDKNNWRLLGDNEICNGVCECLNCKDEEDCEFHEALKDVGFLVVQDGIQPEQDGVYELVEDAKGHPGYFRHAESSWLFFREKSAWSLGSGGSPSNINSTSAKSNRSLSIP